MEKLRIIGCAILETVPGNEFFTLDRVVEISGFGRCDVKRTIERLSREKLILTVAKKAAAVEVALGKGRPPLAITYHLADKKALRERVAPKMKEDTIADRLWKAIRYKRVFTIKYLASMTDVKWEYVRWFVKGLRRAGIVAMNGPGGPGTTWRLIKDVGPRRPYIKKDAGTVRRGDTERAK